MNTEVKVIDCHYMGQEKLAAAYLLEYGGELACVDTNTNDAVPGILDALESMGRAPDDVRYIVVTHVHLDHAGGCGQLLAACPNATVLAHPRATRHLVDPSRLVASARSVYGDAEFNALYGTISGIDESRVQSMDDESTVELGGHALRFLHTRGHANHHLVLWDVDGHRVFSGDAFGLTYPLLQGPGPLTFPSSSPTDFDPELARQSVRRIKACALERVYPTHFGEVADVALAASQMMRHLDHFEVILNDAIQSDRPDEELEAYCAVRMRDYFTGLLNQHGALGSDPAVWAWLKLDLDLNAQGIAFVATKARKVASE
ncbi:MAG: MBL fold metallo-hydrolase [Myxococcota bacterium]